MRILHIITRLILGGAQENTLLSCRYLARQGHEVILAFGPIYGPEGSLLDQARPDGYGLEEIPALRRAILPWLDIQAYVQCRRLIRRIKPDVVHTHSSKAGILGRAAAWAEKVPAVVHTIHGLPFHPYQASWLHALYVAAEKYAARRCHKILCVAQAMQHQALVAGVGHRSQYGIVYSGMEVETFLQDPGDRRDTRESLGIAPEDVVVGTVARLASLKGHDDLLEGLGPLLAQRPALRLLWVGDGWLRPKLQKRIADLGLEGRVVITGLVAPERIPALLRAMDLLVHPSYREGLARALPQAMLSGLPVVSYDVDGASEICQDLVTGRLVKAGDLEGLREAVAWMVDHPGERGSMAQSARARCRELFPAQRMALDLEAVYRQILDGGGSGPTP